MSDYFSQLSQQTGLRFSADRQGVALAGMTESGNSNLDLSAAIPGEEVREIEVAANDPWQIASQPELSSDTATRPAVQSEQNSPEWRQEVVEPTQPLAQQQLQPWVDRSATRDVEPVVEPVRLEGRSAQPRVSQFPISPTETGEIQRAPIAEALFSTPPEPIQRQALPPIQERQSLVNEEQPPAIASSPPVPLPQQQLGWQAVREWLTGTPPLEQGLPSESGDRPVEPPPTFNQLPDPTVPTAPAIPVIEPRSLDRLESDRMQTQEFTLAIGSINLTLEASPASPEVHPSVPPSTPSPAPFSAPTRLSRYYLRVR